MYSTKDKVIDALAGIALVTAFIIMYVAASLADLMVAAGWFNILNVFNVLVCDLRVLRAGFASSVLIRVRLKARGLW